MNDHIGKAVTITAGGKTWTLSRYTTKVLSEVLKWATAQLQHPLDAIKKRLEGLPLEFQKVLFDDARESAKTWGTLANPEIDALMKSPEGVTKTIQLLLEGNHPGITEEEVGDVLHAVLEEHGQGYVTDKMSVAMGTPPATEQKKTKQKRIRS